MKLIFRLIFLFIVTFSCLSVNNVYSTQSDSKLIKNQSKNNWKYETKLVGIDKMKMVFGSTRSINSLNLSFPYNGRNHGEIVIRNSEKVKEIEILFLIDKGQILCDLDNCVGRIKFDSNSSREFSGSKPRDSSDMIFIYERKEILESILSSKKVFIEVPMWNQGKQILEFNVDGLNIDKLQLK